MNIRDFMTEYLRQRDMTLLDLTAKLGYRSKTSLVRIMNGEISVRSLDAFAGRMRKLGALTEEESIRLDEAVEYMRWQDDYYPAREMLDFLQGNIREEGSITLDFINPAQNDASAGQLPLTFDDVFKNGSEIEIQIVNSQYVPIYDKIYELITRMGAKVSHYLVADEDTSRTIHAMNAIFPIVFLPGYSGYLLRQSGAEGHNGIQASDFMLANWTNGSGVRCESLILFVNPNFGRVYRSVNPGTLARLVEIPKEGYRPIKKSFVDGFGGINYVDFCIDCADIERNRRMFGIKPDIAVEYIPVNILLNAAREGELGKSEGFEKMEDALVDIFERRFRNTFQCRKAHHLIMKRSAVWKFVRTGRLSDHFWGMRPFTLRERAEIMRHLLEQAENNPFFHLYFLKDNQFIRDIEVFCFDGKGLLIVNANTDYDLAQGHAEVMVDHPEFQRLYKDFYQKHLAREHAISQADTLDFLRSLVEYCEDPNTTENEN